VAGEEALGLSGASEPGNLMAGRFRAPGLAGTRCAGKLEGSAAAPAAARAARAPNSIAHCSKKGSG